MYLLFKLNPNKKSGNSILFIYNQSNYIDFFNDAIGNLSMQATSPAELNLTLTKIE